MTDKKVTLTLVGLDGNAFGLMATFKRQALKEGWSKEEIDEVIKECQSGDYDHLLQTLIEHCNDDEENDYDDLEVEEDEWEYDENEDDEEDLDDKLE
jgi:hypothetical protein